MNDPGPDAAAPLHERLEKLAVAIAETRPLWKPYAAATLLEAAAALRQPEGEVAQVIAWLQHEYDECMEEGLLEEEPDEIRAYVENVRAALAHLRRLAVVDAEPRRLGVWPALRDVAQERCRQTSAEGWSASHDDDHDDGALAKAAAVYALLDTDAGTDRLIRETWPWELQWLKPKDKRRNLVRAAALLIAEIECLDRALPPAPAAEG